MRTIMTNKTTAAQSHPKVFLGGTCNESNWRSDLIEKLKLDYFNPVVDDWTPECQVEELRQRQTCDICLYVITPKMTGVYSIAEVVDDSNKRPTKTVLRILDTDGGKSFPESQKRSLKAVAKLVKSNGCKVFDALDSLAAYLNSKI
jgi:hypothetical protein